MSPVRRSLLQEKQKKSLTRSGVEYTSLESDNLNLDSPGQASPRLSSSSLNSNDDNNNNSGSPSSRPLGVKKSKIKRKIVDQTTSVINTLEEGNKHFLEQLKKSSEQRQHDLEIQKDLNVREYFEAVKAQILQKRGHQQQNQQTPPPSTSFGQYFNDLCGSKSNLPDY
ncbi:unnamed protein product [Brassica oleracea]